MNKAKFDKILIEEGIESKSLRDDIWKARPFDELEEEKVRTATRMLMGLHGKEIIEKAKKDKARRAKQ